VCDGEEGEGSGKGGVEGVLGAEGGVGDSLSFEILSFLSTGHHGKPCIPHKIPERGTW